MSATLSKSARGKSIVVIGSILFAAALVGFAAWYMVRSNMASAVTSATSTSTDTSATASPGAADVPADEASVDIVEFPQELWPAAGLQIQTATYGGIAETVELNGKVTLNEDRVAHIYPLIEGRVDRVDVQLGQKVKAGDVLAVVQSQEIGRAKLQLYQDRLLRDFAAVKRNWTQAVAENTGALIDALKQETPIEILEETFRNRPMGEFRAKLLSAYVNFDKSRIDFERIAGLSDEGVVPAKQRQAAEAARNADRATLKAHLEEIDHESRHAALLAEQALKEAETRVSVDETNLKILGYTDETLSRIDPAREGETLSHYPIHAPFDGTVISKDVVLMERVSTDTMIASVADLTSVWITTDIYEEHLPLLRRLAGTTIRVTSSVWPDRVFEARVFYTGEIVDESTRTLSMRAAADNAEGLLKPGMFVKVELTEGHEENSLQVPVSAVLELDGKPIIFVHKGDDHFERHDVVVGRRTADRVEIREGLHKGEAVAVQGGFALKTRMLANLLGEE